VIGEGANEVPKVINIRDPIHGFISLDDSEAEVVQTSEFQRLRFISQLGTTNWVYPGATHTRFEHSLGVLYLAKTIIERLSTSGLKIEEKDKSIFKFASLLHDIGHGPFSHIGEEAKIFKNGLNHELMAEKIITDSKIGQLLSNLVDSDGVERIVFIVKSAEGIPRSQFDTLFSDLLTGQAGIDRMDYLLRDSHYLGVTYGKCDLFRLLETARYDSENDLYWEEGGIHALEQFILARYFMFKDVYYHKTRRALDFHLSNIIKSYLIEIGEEGCLPVDINKYLQLNDIVILSYILRNHEAMSIFFDRGFYRLIDTESDDHPEEAELLLWDWLETELNQKFGSDVYIDKAENAPYKFEKADQIKVQLGGKVIPLQEASRLVNTLRPIRKRRVYAPREKRSEVSEFVRSFLKEKRRK
jgi:HD superfamily phosphohydrolase